MSEKKKKSEKMQKKTARNKYYWSIIKKGPEYLNAFLEDKFKIKLPNKSFCKGHSPPLEFVWNTLIETHKGIMAVANRSGGKTFDFALLAALWNYFHDGCEVVDIGAVQKQANQCYEYYTQMIKKKIYAPYYNPRKSLLSNTELNNGSKMQIFAGTVNAVNGPHPQKSMADEVELLKWSVLQEFFSMSKSKAGIRGQNILGSTRKYSFGPVQRLLKSKEERGIKVYRWCAKEVMAKPKLSRAHWKNITKKVGNRIISFWEIFGEHYDDYDGFLDEEDVIEKFQALDWETFESQWLCQKPSKKGIIYPHFLDEPPMVGDYKYNPELPTYACQDFGFSNPCVTLYLQITASDDIIIFEEDYKTQTELSKIIESTYLPKFKKYKILEWWADPSGAQEIAEMKAKGLPMYTKSARVLEGIPLVRKIVEEGRLKVDRSCKNFIEEMNNYHYVIDKDGEPTDTPAKENDHGPDALRYFCSREIKDEKQKTYGLPSIIGIKGVKK